MTNAQELYELVDQLREVVEAANEARHWANDSQFAQSYKQLAEAAAAAFPDDPVIGQLQISIPSEFDTLIRGDPSCLTTWVRMQVGRLAIRLSQHARRQAGPARTIVDLDLAFMQDDVLRNITASDFTEAQRCYYADSPKAAALLFGAALEGMLLDVLRRPDIEEDERFSAFLRQNNRRRIVWSRASLHLLLNLAEALRLIRPTTARLATSVVDFRNTVHPAAEAHSGSRSTVREANILLQVVELVATDLQST